MQKALFDILVCPSCNGKLKMTKDGGGLFCSFDRLLYKVEDGIPNMLIDEARKLSIDEADGLELR